jgi:DNA-binding transcriptional ArsR family regulator
MTTSNKTRIRSLIFALPGVHLRQIQRILGLSFSSVRYNVDSLKNDREVVHWDGGGHSRLFPPAVSEWERIIYSALRTRSSRKVLRALAKGGRLTNRELSEITGYAKSTVSESTHRLFEAGVLTTSFSLSGRIAYQIKDPERVIPLLRAADQTVLEEATDRFVQLWDF